MIHLEEKEIFIRKAKGVSYTGEEDLLYHYIRNYDERRRRHTFVNAPDRKIKETFCTFFEEDWNNLWNSNVTSAVGMSKEIIPVFLKKGAGKIINISSVWGNCGASCEVAYSATKGAINSFTKALAKELAPSNIQVNAISCGIIDTKMNAHLTKEDINALCDEIPCGRIGTPYDVAKAVFSLIKTSDYLTGQIITLDGGWTV